MWEEEKDGFYKGHTKNYILVYGKVKDNDNKNDDNLEEKKEIENTITKAKCIEAEQDHILVEM